DVCSSDLEKAEHSLAGLRGERQGGGGQLLPGLQSEQVGAFLVRVGEGEGVSTGLQRVDRRLGEVLADLHGRQVRTERLRLRTQRGQRSGQVGARQGDVGGAAKVVVGIVDRKRASGGEVDGIDCDARRALFVQHDRQVR